jgi:hypothetical protein
LTGGLPPRTNHLRRKLRESDMAAREDIAKIIEQEKALGFSAFDELSR